MDKIKNISVKMDEQIGQTIGCSLLGTYSLYEPIRAPITRGGIYFFGLSIKGTNTVNFKRNYD